MEELRELYQQVILDHNKNPRNFKKLNNATHEAEGDNPLCGDHINLYLILDGDMIKEISFTGKGCAISKSSASLMTSELKNKTITEARLLFEKFHSLVSHDTGNLQEYDELGKLRVFSGVREFPIRVKCASLAWHTMIAALENKKQVATTE